jgi:hypothetical protein
MPTINGNIAGRPASREARCVNRLHLHNHKVPRSRAQLTVAWRISTRTRVTAGSSIEPTGLSRCVDGKTWKSAGLRCGPSFKAAIEETVGAKGLRQLRRRWARGNLTTGSSGV